MPRTQNLVNRIGSGRKFPKLVFVSGGVLSGLGKGVTTASTALLLKSRNYKVTTIKCDMYLNVDAGTMNPIEHGEVFVTADGVETDQDIGHYERFLGEDLPGKNYLTAGKVYLEVLNRERRLEYRGKSIDAFEEIPEEIIRKIAEAAKGYQIAMIELGGTVGEYQNIMFFEAIRRLKIRRPESTLLIHLGYLPIPKTLGEMKSKPLQQSIQGLNSLGLRPDFIVARAEKEIDRHRREKIAFAAALDPEKIIANPDVDDIYKVPLVLEKQGFSGKILNQLGLPKGRIDLKKWEKMVQKPPASRAAKIGMVTKYITSGDFTLEDAYICVNEALRHAAHAQGTPVEIVWVNAEELEEAGPEKIRNILGDLNGIIVPQGWGRRGTEGKIKAIRFARENKIPYLGLCFGMQMAAIEFARDVLKLKGANTEEANPATPHPVIHIMPNQKEYLKKKQFGGTIRLGDWPCEIQPGTLLRRIYGREKVLERHRHRYEFNNRYAKRFERAGMVFSGLSPDGKLVEALELKKEIHPFFVGVQFHPELESRPLQPHPIFLAFLQACFS